MGEEGASRTAGGGVRLQGWAQRGSSHPGERAEDSVSPERDRQLEDSVRLPDRPAGGNSWGSVCGPHPPSMCSRRRQGEGTLAPLRLLGHFPKTISSVRQEGPSERKAGDTHPH